MPAWWMQPNEPEKPKEEPNVEEVERPELLSEEGKRKAWRMLSLIDAFRKVHTDPLSLDEIDLLGKVAAGSEDLHDACAALRNGCTLDFLVIIFAD